MNSRVSHRVHGNDPWREVFAVFLFNFSDPVYLEKKFEARIILIYLDEDTFEPSSGPSNILKTSPWGHNRAPSPLCVTVRLQKHSRPGRKCRLLQEKKKHTKDERCNNGAWLLFRDVSLMGPCWIFHRLPTGREQIQSWLNNVCTHHLISLAVSVQPTLDGFVRTARLLSPGIRSRAPGPRRKASSCNSPLKMYMHVCAHWAFISVW